jgi:hypothetical protein
MGRDATDDRQRALVLGSRLKVQYVNPDANFFQEHRFSSILCYGQKHDACTARLAVSLGSLGGHSG